MNSLGVSDWIEVSQERINTFAEATGDFQWIHVDTAKAAKELPTGATIAHGFLTLSLVAGLPVFEVGNLKNAINYGCNKVRFTNMVPAGSRVRLRQTLQSAEDMPGGGVRTVCESVMEIELDEWIEESWTARRPWSELAADFDGWHEDILAIIERARRFEFEPSIFEQVLHLVIRETEAGMSVAIT